MTRRHKPKNQIKALCICHCDVCRRTNPPSPPSGTQRQRTPGQPAQHPHRPRPVSTSHIGPRQRPEVQGRIPPPPPPIRPAPQRQPRPRPAVPRPHPSVQGTEGNPQGGHNQRESRPANQPATQRDLFLLAQQVRILSELLEDLLFGPDVI